MLIHKHKKCNRSARFFKVPTNYVFKVASSGSDLECSLSKLETVDFISIINNTLNM